MTDGVPMDQAQYDRICDAWRRLEADAGAEPAPIDWLAINREFAA
jgi:hypothetical protein